MADKIEEFIKAFADSLLAQTFVKMTLGNYKGSVEQLQKILVRPVITKSGRHLAFQVRYFARETVTNVAYEEAAATVHTYLSSGFRSAHLFTTTNDFQLSIGKKSAMLRAVKPTFTEPLPVEHDRRKNYLIDPSAYYLKALGVTTDSGEVRAQQQDKWRQINKFVETLSHLIDESELRTREMLRVVDMGSGKGYLTFAAYDYLTHTRGFQLEMTGVDTKRETVSLCNDIATACNFSNLKFVNGTIGDYDIGEADVVIALHACDTATDDALFKGVRSNAAIIIAAPCCHKEVRRQIKPPPGMNNFLRHGALLEQTAEIATDGLRSLLLERSGYNTKVFEFVAPEHTPKNNMIAAIKASSPRDVDRVSEEIAGIMSFYGIEHQRLDDLLA